MFAFCFFSSRHGRSMRSSSPDHHHHHSTGRHRDLPPRGSSHWGHSWPTSSDHHFSYDYDYSSSSSSHHYSRRGRHSARLAKPEMYMEDAMKLKHSGDRMVILHCLRAWLSICVLIEFRCGEGTTIFRSSSHLHDLLCEQGGEIWWNTT